MPCGVCGAVCTRTPTSAIRSHTRTPTDPYSHTHPYRPLQRRDPYTPLQRTSTHTDPYRAAARLRARHGRGTGRRRRGQGGQHPAGVQEAPRSTREYQGVPGSIRETRPDQTYTYQRGRRRTSRANGGGAGEGQGQGRPGKRAQTGRGGANGLPKGARGAAGPYRVAKGKPAPGVAVLPRQLVDNSGESRGKRPGRGPVEARFSTVFHKLSTSYPQARRRGDLT